ncbi:MAG: hypothetical protein H7833_11550 [Magnetococcus sp. DMHC-1]
MDQSLRPIPRHLIMLLIVALLFQGGWKFRERQPVARMQDLAPPPRLEMLHLWSLGDPTTAARFGMLWLQTFDAQPDVIVPLREMNYHNLVAWLERILELDPRSEYPLFAAVRIYGFVPDAQRERMMMDFVHRAFPGDPPRRWKWLAFAAVQTLHRLQDPDRALLYMRDIDQKVQSQQLPFWVRGLHARILYGKNEFDSARSLMQALLARGGVTSTRQKQALELWLEKLKEKGNPHENQ